MASINLYTFEDEDGGEETFSTFSYAEAEEHARRYRLLIVSHEYEWSDSEPVADYRSRRPEPIAGLPIAGDPDEQD